mmetsp:Transcript_11298/g.17104  ORF Transcript_11298/g.17104 Transcript_11298/m.17104 type:complete len:234 (-) Transcript_11298:175-876(-)
MVLLLQALLDAHSRGHQPQRVLFVVQPRLGLLAHYRGRVLSDARVRGAGHVSFSLQDHLGLGSDDERQRLLRLHLLGRNIVVQQLLQSQDVVHADCLEAALFGGALLFFLLFPLLLDMLALVYELLLSLRAHVNSPGVVRSVLSVIKQLLVGQVVLRIDRRYVLELKLGPSHIILLLSVMLALLGLYEDTVLQLLFSYFILHALIDSSVGLELLVAELGGRVDLEELRLVMKS